MQLSMLRTSVSSLGKTSTVWITTSLRRSTTTTNNQMGINRWEKDFETSKFCTNNPLPASLKTQEFMRVSDISVSDISVSDISVSDISKWEDSGITARSPALRYLKKLK